MRHMHALLNRSRMQQRAASDLTKRSDAVPRLNQQRVTDICFQTYSSSPLFSIWQEHSHITDTGDELVHAADSGVLLLNFSVTVSGSVIAPPPWWSVSQSSLLQNAQSPEVMLYPLVTRGEMRSEDTCRPQPIISQHQYEMTNTRLHGASLMGSTSGLFCRLKSCWTRYGK